MSTTSTPFVAPAARRVPLWLKVAYTAFMAVLVPVYLRKAYCADIRENVKFQNFVKTARRQLLITGSRVQIPAGSPINQ